MHKYGGIAQLARVLGSYPIGRRFESHCRYHIARNFAAVIPPEKSGGIFATSLSLLFRKKSRCTFAAFCKRAYYASACCQLFAGNRSKISMLSMVSTWGWGSLVPIFYSSIPPSALLRNGSSLETFNDFSLLSFYFFSQNLERTIESILCGISTIC